MAADSFECSLGRARGARTAQVAWLLHARSYREVTPRPAFREMIDTLRWEDMGGPVAGGQPKGQGRE